MLAEKTVKLRHKLALASVQLIAPKLKKELTTDRDYACNGTPRPFTKMLKETYGRTPLVGAEIGFGYGANAKSLLKELNIRKLYCIDPYFGSQPYQDTGVTVDWFTKEKNPNFDKELQKFWIFNNAHFIYATSDEAFTNNLIPRELDFIYIDGCHTREYCLRDICNSMMFVKKGGYVGGHDFANGGLVGVEQAVFEYYHFTGNKPTCVYPDFWFRRN